MIEPEYTENIIVQTVIKHIMSTIPHIIQKPQRRFSSEVSFWLREKDLNLRPSGYEPDELPDCSTPRYISLLRSSAFMLLSRPRLYSITP